MGREEDHILDFLNEPQPLSLFQMQFTEYNISPKQYALSQTGKDDLLGTWAYDSSREEEHIFGEDTAYEGVLGPEPFEGASPEDYKLLRFIDGGNNLELRGKPQEAATGCRGFWQRQSISGGQLGHGLRRITSRYSAGWQNRPGGRGRRFTGIMPIP